MEAEQFADTIPHGDPIALFDDWYVAARAAEPSDSNAMALATATPDGLPSVRMVLLKGHGADGFLFYTNSHSRKGQEILANPQAALLFHWKSLRRQVRIEGPLSAVSAETVDAYFASRSRDSQLGAVASDQSAPLAVGYGFDCAHCCGCGLSDAMPATPDWPPKSLPRLFVRATLGKESRSNWTRARPITSAMSCGSVPGTKRCCSTANRASGWHASAMLAKSG